MADQRHRALDDLPSLAVPRSDGQLGTIAFTCCRWYAWALITTISPRHSLLVRHLKTGELAFHAS